MPETPFIPRPNFDRRKPFYVTGGDIDHEYEVRRTCDDLWIARYTRYTSMHPYDDAWFLADLLNGTIPANAPFTPVTTALKGGR